MRWNWVGLVAVVLACAEAPRPVLKRWPLEEVPVLVHVTDAASQPIPGVSLIARRADRGSVVARGGTTDATGMARLQVMPGWYVLQADAPGFVSMTRTDARVPFSDAPRWDVTLERAAPIAGRVVDAEGRPVARARLRLLRAGEPLSLPATESDAEGRFHIDGVPAGVVTLRAEKDNWSPTRMEFTAPAPELMVVMGRLGSLRVQVLDPQQHRLPEPSAWLALADEDEDAPALTLNPTREPGAMLFPDLPAGRYHITGRYTPLAGCEWSRTIEVQVLPGQQAEATVSFEGTQGFGPWRARALDTSGRALGAGLVRAWMGKDREDTPGLRGRCAARVEQDGAFSLSHVFEPLFMLTWDSDEPAPTRMLKGALVAGTGEALVFPREGGALKGHVVRPDGLPVGYFEVDGHFPDNPRGEYVRSVWMNQTYQWVIDVLGFAPALVRAQGRDAEVLQVPDVVLDVGRTVQGRLFASNDRTGVPNQEVQLVETFDLDSPSPRRPRAAMTDAEGRFRFDHVAGRRLYLRVDAKEQGTVIHGLEPGETAARLRLVPNAELQGSVTDGARVPFAGVRLDVRCEGGLRVSAGTDGAGHYAVSIPANRECFVHPECSPLNVRGGSQPPPASFSPMRLRMKAGSRQVVDFEPREGMASLHAGVDASREFVTAFLLPGDVPWPRSSEALDALIRSGFRPDPRPDTWESEEGDAFFIPSFMVGAGFDFNHLPLGRYTLFIRDEMDGADAVLRIPVELTGTDVHVIHSERSGHGGGRPYTR